MVPLLLPLADFFVDWFEVVEQCFHGSPGFFLMVLPFGSPSWWCLLDSGLWLSLGSPRLSRAGFSLQRLNNLGSIPLQVINLAIKNRQLHATGDIDTHRLGDYSIASGQHPPDR